MIETGKMAKVIAEESGMLIVNDTKKAEEVISKILSENAEAVSQYQSGEKESIRLPDGTMHQIPSRCLHPQYNQETTGSQTGEANRQLLRKNLLTRQMRQKKLNQ